MTSLRRPLARRPFLGPALLVAGWVTLPALAGQPVHGQAAVPADPQPGAGETDAGPRISLTDVVRRTLVASPRVRQAEQSVAQSHGRRQEAAGAFDGLAFFTSSYSEQRVSLLRNEVGEEIKRRIPMEFTAIALFDGPPGALDRAADLLIGGARDTTPGSLLFDNCRGAPPPQLPGLQRTQLGQTPVVVELPDGGTITICLNADGIFEGIELGSLDQLGVANLDQLVRALDVLDALGAGFEEDLRADIADLLRNVARSLRDVASLLRRQRELLGALPEEKALLDLNLDLGYQRLLRNGLAVTGGLGLIGTEDNFVDKPLEVNRGDNPFVPNTFTTTAALTLNVPLGRGRGQIATAGPERASVALARAEEAILVHTASEDALQALTAYWALAAAQARQRVLEDSAEVQAGILDATRRLVEAQELPGAEQSRAEARHEEVLGQLAAARRAVVERRLDLVRAMGESIERLEETPLAADPLPRRHHLAGAPDAWIERARLRRQDIAATAHSVTAADLLHHTARANLRYPVDLEFNVSYSGFHDSFDQRLYDLSGYRDAVNGIISGPSYRIALSFDLPFRNRAARGRLLQAQAALTQGQITHTDLERQVRLAIQDRRGSYDRRAEGLLRLEEQLEQQERALEASLVQFRLADIPLIDLLSTESQLTGARLAVVDARQDLAILHHQILFEAGELLVVPEAGDGVQADDLRLAPRAIPDGTTWRSEPQELQDVE